MIRWVSLSSWLKSIKASSFLPGALIFDCIGASFWATIPWKKEERRIGYCVRDFKSN